MLAIGRSFMSEPKLLCIDEPSTGLAPKMRAEVFEKILQINRLGITILLVEQEVSSVFKMTKRNYVLSQERSSPKVRATNSSKTKSSERPIWVFKSEAFSSDPPIFVIFGPFPSCP